MINNICPYCNHPNLYLKSAKQYPNNKNKIDIYCKSCGYICTATLNKNGE